jgi:predicted AAA+ superfamily ATPase
VRVGKLGEREVDFVAEKDGNREYYQVAYRLIDPKTVEREFSVLEAVPDSFPKTVLTLDRIPIKRNGIHHCYLPAWLLGQVN